ncbi:phage tail protein [Paenibacillus sp. MWE-103]|uniref:Phage tail protein n=1 Tax=Paenibacillus artemisiicola TaxID=1172618 RepID=A0ABS3W5K3_9BACL|nr:phage tail protein [Paenibacillus artemisiicola]MBO7743569.1 phage tail protein [Paenibacillus artemisiicola]
MPTGQRKDPFRNFRFRVEIDGIQQAGFSDASGFDSTIDVIEYREGTDPTSPRKLPGLTKYGNITLKWGQTDSLDLYNWHKEAIAGSIQRRNMSVIVVDEAGNDKGRWDFAGAWPTKYDAPDFSAKGNDIAIESLEIVHEGMNRVS